MNKNIHHIDIYIKKLWNRICDVFQPYFQFETIKLDYKVRKLQRDRNKEEHEYNAWIRDASSDEKDRLISEYFFAMQHYDEEIHRIYHQLIRTQAERYFIPFPEFTSDFSIISKTYIETKDGRAVLSLDKLHKLRAEIRKEKSERLSLPAHHVLCFFSGLSRASRFLPHLPYGNSAAALSGVAGRNLIRSNHSAHCPARQRPPHPAADP